MDFNIEKLNRQSPHLNENAIINLIKSTEEKLEAEERLLSGTENKGQIMSIKGRIDNLKKKLEELNGEKGRKGHA